ncbi:hypothetical protein XU18_4714 [Perkinsela sp. CCAP 1560/4]|nr:hypothetical protein XU18_4714 [Perkinsela sp. CCAP 1560/4]|eukprot:KNH03957.1 hypothetical protein XU18_4714 [Perkinsela sp. CCAP 1560/4]
MTRLATSARLITTADLWSRITNASPTATLKGHHSKEVLNRFRLCDPSPQAFLLLDVRSCIEVERSGMILGAQVLPSYYLYYALTQTPDKLMATFGMAYPEKHQLIVCYADDGQRAGDAHTTLSYLGFRNVRTYKEGIEGFRSAYPHLIGKLPIANE